jgi:ribonuclease P protein component
MERRSGPPEPQAEALCGAALGGRSPADGVSGRSAAQAAASGSERLLARNRLLRRTDFLRCYRTGRRRQGALVILYFAPNSHGFPRMGITASRKVGNAVIRHRLKRRIREIYRRWPGRGTLAALDLVMHLKPEARGAGFADVQRDIAGLLQGVANQRARSDRRPPGA